MVDSHGIIEKAGRIILYLGILLIGIVFIHREFFPKPPEGTTTTVTKVDTSKGTEATIKGDDVKQTVNVYPTKEVVSGQVSGLDSTAMRRMLEETLHEYLAHNEYDTTLQTDKYKAHFKIGVYKNKLDYFTHQIDVYNSITENTTILAPSPAVTGGVSMLAGVNRTAIGLNLGYRTKKAHYSLSTYSDKSWALNVSFNLFNVAR